MHPQTLNSVEQFTTSVAGVPLTSAVLGPNVALDHCALAARKPTFPSSHHHLKQKTDKVVTDDKRGKVKFWIFILDSRCVCG